MSNHILGTSGRNIILHLDEHRQIDRQKLVSRLKIKPRNRVDEIFMFVYKTLSEYQQSFLKIPMGHYDSLKEYFAEIEAALDSDMESFAEQVRQLGNIYGISTTASCAIIALARKLLVTIYTMLK